MAKWDIKVKRNGNYLYFNLLRKGVQAGRLQGSICGYKYPGQKYFHLIGFEIEPKFQKEHMKAHGGLKMGERIAFSFLRVMKEEGVSHIQPWWPQGKFWRLITRINTAAGASVIERPDADGFWKINWEMVPATEEALKVLVGKMRANEAKAKADARAAKIKRAREWAKRLFRRTRPK